MASIHLATEIPGPESVKIVERRRAAMSAGAAFLTELGVASADGAVVTDVDGNRLLDFAGGIGVLAAGHCPPTVVDAIQKQAGELLHICGIVATHDSMVQLAEALNDAAPGDFPKKTLLMNSGAEAVESAVMTMSMTSKYGLFKKGFGPFASEIYRIPFPNVLRRPPGTDPEQFVGWSIERLHDALISQVDPSGLAAIVIEPVQGEGGFIPAPKPYLEAIRSICDEHGIIMVADEVQAGFGRTGKLFSIEHSGVVPDLITIAKSMGSGMPISGVTGRAELLDAPHPGGMGGTYSGNPVACVAALETIRMINTPEFLGRAEAVGARLRAGLETLQQQYESRPHACGHEGDARSGTHHYPRRALQQLRAIPAAAHDHRRSDRRSTRRARRRDGRGDRRCLMS